MKFIINSIKFIKSARPTGRHIMSTVKNIKEPLYVLTFSVIALVAVFATQSILNTPAANAKRALSDSEARIFAQNNIIGWDPGECSESSSSTGICGDTPKEKYWSYLRQTFDEVHTAAIIGNIDNEGGYGPTRWEIGKVVNKDGGYFLSPYDDWNNLYNCQPCHVGVGAVGITWNLGNYLKYIEQNIPDALPFFKDSSYSLPGEQALEKMGSADFDKVVEAEMSWVIEEATGILEEFNKITDVREAAKFWAENYEKCQGCLASQGMTTTKQKRMDDAEYEYEALKGFVCQNTSSDSPYSSTSFSLSDGELYGMIHMAKNEQGSVEGIKFELSLMANKADQAGRSDIVSYIRNSSWFASSTRNSYSESRGSLSDAEIQAGREVLINGNRSIPPQIVEHDCIGDIDWLELDGQRYYASGAGGCRGTGLFRSEYYVSGKTKIHNVYDSTYIFYTFPASGDINSGDPFGYFENNPPSSASSPSNSPSSNSESSSTNSETISGHDITWIGDSYSVQADNKGLLSSSAEFSGVDIGSSPNNTSSSYIQGSKFVSSGSSSNPSCLSILEKIINSNSLRSYLVFACGTNGGWSDSDISKFQDLLKDKDAKVVVVTSKIPSNDYADSNNRLRAMVSANSNFKLADWTTVYDEKYFEGDSEKIHPISDPGYEKWINVISDALRSFGGCNSYEGDYPQYYQGNYADSDHENSSQDWTVIPYDGGNVADSGCGPTSMAMLTTVATGQDIYPQDIIDVTLPVGNYVYTSPTVLDPIVGEKYGFEVIAESYSSKTDAYDKIKKYLQDGYMIHLSGEGCHEGFATVRGDGSCTPGHYVGIFSIGSDDRVQVANTGYMGNSEVPLQSIIDAIHNGVFTAIKGSGNKTSCDNDYCSTSSSKSVSSSGITSEQAEKIAHYYNTKYIAQGCCGLKNCVEFSRFFVTELTTKNGASATWPNGDLVVNSLVSSGLATSGDEPKAWAVFSKTSGQHTGVVVGVNSDGTYITIEAAYPGWTDGYVDGNGNGRVYTNKTFDDGIYKFAYFADSLNSTKINEIINN